ncbi:MAG: N,N-dimethylformamidase beta subunit family domain-containing protein [Candidatus Nitrosopolaris sp.]
MKQSDRSVLGAAMIFLLVLTTCTYILLIVSNSRPLFAQIRVLVHGRTSTRELIVDQNLKTGDISTRARIQRNSLPISRVLNMTASNLHIDDTPSVASENNNADISNQFKKGMRMALVEPTFTAAAYNNSFYVFYQKYSHVPAETNITNDLSLLSSRVIKYPTITPTTKVHSAFAMLSLLKNFKLVSPGSNITVLTDADVDDGLIFENRGGEKNVDTDNNAYDVIILGHQEYVTQQEYNYLKKFVSNGGTMLLLDGNVFYAQIKFDRNTSTVTLVKGHGWAFNGRSAWKNVAERWAKETSEWVGSNYLCYSCDITFANDPWEYKHHEEQYITNHKDKILMNYNASLIHYPIPSLRPIIATYELNYQKGRVISLGIYSDDIITNESFDKYLGKLVSQYSVQKQGQQQPNVTT